MKKRTLNKLRQIVAFIIILTMLTSSVVVAADSIHNYSHEQENAFFDLDSMEIPGLYDRDYTDLQTSQYHHDFDALHGFDTHGFDAYWPGDRYIELPNIADLPTNELTELSPEALAEIWREQEANRPPTPHEQMTMELTQILTSAVNYSRLTEIDRAFIFNYLDIADVAPGVAGELFTMLERDGFTLAQSLELMRILSRGLFSYEEALSIFTQIPCDIKRMFEVIRFEDFAQRFDIATDINARRLVYTPFRPINDFDGSGLSISTTPDGARRAVNISSFLTPSSYNEEYSFIEAAQINEWERMGINPQDFDTWYMDIQVATPPALYLRTPEPQEQHPEQDNWLYMYGERRILQSLRSREEYTSLGLDIAVQTRPWSGFNFNNLEHSETAYSIFTAFTSEPAFNTARQMFLSNHSTAEIEAAFALGAALQVEPQTFMLQPGIYRAESTRLFAEDIAEANRADNARDTGLSQSSIDTTPWQPQLESDRNRLTSPSATPAPQPPPGYSRPAMDLTFDLDLVRRTAGIGTREMDSIIEYGKAILNLAVPMADTPTHDNIISDPFSLRFNADESMCLNTGAVTFRKNILSLPGRGGFDLNLDLIYESALARTTGSQTQVTTRQDFHGLGLGWMFDLPYIKRNTLYLPGRGRFALNGNTIVNYTLRDMQMHSYSRFTSGGVTSYRRLTFHNGTSYFFARGGYVIGMQDRFGNTIRFEYTTGINPISNFVIVVPPLTRIVDSNGNHINFRETVSGTNRTITVTSPDNSTFVINLSRIPWIPPRLTGNGYPIRDNGYQIDSVQNQVGAITTFTYSREAGYSCTQTKSPRNRGYNFLLRQVNYPSGAQLRLYYAWFTENLGRDGSRFSWRLWYRQLIVDGRDYETTNFTFQGDSTNFPMHVTPDRPQPSHTYNLTIRQNNGLRTVHNFNYRHSNTSTRTYNGNTLLSVQTAVYNSARLPTSITLTEHRGSLSRATTRQFIYNAYGQITTAVSPLAQGSTNARYRTIITYDTRFGLPLTTTTMPDANTTVREVNTLSTDGRNVIRTNIYENNVRQSRTDFFHDAHGNVTEIREFPVANGSDFITTQITYDRGTLPQSMRTTNVRDINNALVGGTGIIETRFTYDAMWRVLSSTDPSGYITRWEYDRVGRVTRVTHPNGGFETYTYNDQQNILTHRTVLGATYTHRFDPLGNLLTITNPSGIQILRNTYDNRMRLTTTRRAPGVISAGETSFRYDVFDRVISTVIGHPYGNGTRQLFTTYFTDILDTAGNSRIMTQTHGDYRAPSIQTFVQYDRFGRITQEGTIGGRIFTYNHDLAGRVIRERSLGIDNNFTYNIFGETSIRNIDGHTARTTYDSMGRMITSSDFMGNTQRFTYDALGRLIQHSIPFDRVGTTTRYSTTRYFYDRNSNLTRTSTSINLPGAAAAWSDTTNTFRHNRLMSSRTGNGPLTEYTYDLAGNVLTKRVGGTGNNSGGAVTSFTYNNRGQLTRTTDALGQSETFTYDANGFMITRTDRNGTTFHMTYNNLGMLIREEARQGATVVSYRSYSFTATGALRMASSNGHTTINYYDAQGRLIRQLDTGNIVKHYTYNTANNLTSTRIYANGVLQTNNTYAYTTAQRLASVTAGGQLQTTYTYNANGQRTRTVYGNGTSTDYTLNASGLATNITHRRGTTVLSSFNYTYYLDGNIQQVVEIMSGETRTKIYTYDTARRLIREVETSNIPVDTPPTTEVTSWAGLRAAIDNAPAHLPITIHISQSFNSANGTAITIPADRNITLVSTVTGANGRRILTQTVTNQGHFIVYGTLTLGQNITLCGGIGTTNISGGVFIRGNGTFIMNSGSIIENIRIRHDCAVVREHASAVFINNGGLLRNIEMPTTIVVDTWAGLRAAINNAPANQPTTIYISQSFSSANEPAIIILANRNITLVSTETGANGRRMLTQTVTNQMHFIVHGTLTLGQNITLCGSEEFTGISGGIAMSNIGRFIMNAGSIIEHIRTTRGAIVAIGGGIFTNFTNNGGVVRFITIIPLTWTCLKTAIENAPTATTRIYIAHDLFSTHGDPITVGSARTVVLVSTATGNDNRTLTKMAVNQPHFIIYGHLIFENNLTMCGGADTTYMSGGALIRGTGSLTINEGSVIENIRTTQDDVVVILEAPTATFINNGGILRNNGYYYNTVRSEDQLIHAIYNTRSSRIYISQSFELTNRMSIANRSVVLASAGPGGERVISQTNYSMPHFDLFFHPIQCMDGILSLGENITLCGGANSPNSGGVVINHTTLILNQGSVIANSDGAGRGLAVRMNPPMGTPLPWGNVIFNGGQIINGLIGTAPASGGLQALDALEDSIRVLDISDNIRMLESLEDGIYRDESFARIHAMDAFSGLSEGKLAFLLGLSEYYHPEPGWGHPEYDLQYVQRLEEYHLSLYGMYDDMMYAGYDLLQDFGEHNIYRYDAYGFEAYAFEVYGHESNDIESFGFDTIATAAVPTSGNITTTRAYTFDNRGNRVTMAVTGAQTYTVTYTYDQNNRLLTETRTADGRNEVTSYTYDRNGNQLTRTGQNQTETRTYNAFNQLITFTRPGITSSYAYRADGLRHSKTINGVRTTHVWNGSHIVLELNTSNVVMNRFYRSRGGRLIRSHHHGWYLHNVRGDVVQRVNASGNVLHNYRYSAFGVERNPDERNTNVFRFAGEYWDWERGEVYLRARSFNPRTGRFTQPDPHWGIHNMQFGDRPLTMNRRLRPNNHAILQAGNLYMYCMHNPVMFVDPSGRAAKTKNAAPIPIEVKVKVIELLINAGAAATALLAAQVFDIDLSVDLGLDLSIFSGGVLSLRPNTRGVGHFATDVAAAVAAVAATITASGELSAQQILDMATALAAVDAARRGEHVFFEARVRGGTLTIGRAMTFDEAADHILSLPDDGIPRGVFTLLPSDAQNLANSLGGYIPRRAGEIHGRGAPGFFRHFHPLKADHTHIWFPGL